jgi:hypothetical protein
VINNTMLLQIALLGWVFLDEAPTAVQWLGLVIVSVGIALSQWRGGSMALRTLASNGADRPRPLEQRHGDGDRAGAVGDRSR